MMKWTYLTIVPGKPGMLRRFYSLPIIISTILAASFICIHFHVLDEKSSTVELPLSVSFSMPQFRRYDDTITIVTAFFDIGAFQKGSNPRYILHQEVYFGWAATFEYLMNPLVVFTDSVKFQKTLEKLRSKVSDKTKIILMDRNSSWVFKKIDQIRDIYKSQGYPKHFPNTVLPEYACAQHAKYDVISRAAKENFFRTNYLARLDVGYFRGIVHNHSCFALRKPPNFNESRVAMNLVYNVSLNIPHAKIFRQNIVWVGGGIFLARRDVIIRYEQMYQRAMDIFLSQKLMNTDQQMNFAIHSIPGRKLIKPEIDIQTYNSKRKDDWFYLGYLMRKIVSCQAL